MSVPIDQMTQRYDYNALCSLWSQELRKKSTKYPFSSINYRTKIYLKYSREKAKANAMVSFGILGSAAALPDLRRTREIIFLRLLSWFAYQYSTFRHTIVAIHILLSSVRTNSLLICILQSHKLVYA